MGLFDKKYCDICGEKIGLLGNRKLSDGNLCKDCAAKLSPWFTERKQSTVEEIREQLRLREENRQKLADFHPTRTIGVDTKVYVDEPGKTFIVTGAQDIMKANPNLIRMDQVADCQMDIRHTRTELKRETWGSLPIFITATISVAISRYSRYSTLNSGWMSSAGIPSKLRRASLRMVMSRSLSRKRMLPI